MAAEFDKKARPWGIACHLAALAGFIGIPFGNLLGPLVVWLVKKGEYPFVDQQGKASLNFQISMTLYGLVAAFLIFVFIGFFLLIALAIFDAIMVIVAALKVSNDESFQYPFTINFIK